MFAALGVTAVTALGTGGTAAATNDYYIYHVDVYEQVTTYQGGPYTLSTDLNRTYCWTVDTPHTTRVSYNYQFDYTIFEVVEIPAHSQSCSAFTKDGLGKPGFDGFPVKFRTRTLCCGTQYNRNGWLHV